MKKIQIILALATTISLGGIAGASAQSAPTFQKSCSSLGYSAPNLTANCKTSSGATVSSSVTLRSIENIDGRLSHTSGPKTGTFYKTCRNISVSTGGRSGVKLSADCQKKNGSWVSSSTEIWDIDNIEGKLKYKW